MLQVLTKERGRKRGEGEEGSSEEEEEEDQEEPPKKRQYVCFLFQFLKVIHTICRQDRLCKLV
jgi:hypothetical protein